MKKGFAYLIQLGLPLLISILALEIMASNFTDDKYFDTDSAVPGLLYIPTAAVFFLLVWVFGKINWLEKLKH